MKLLVVASSESVRTTCEHIGRQLGFTEIVKSSNRDSVHTLQKEMPTHVIFNFDDEHPVRVHRVGGSWQIFRQTASEEIRIVRIGFIDIREPDYLRLPALIGDFRTILFPTV